MKRFDDYEDDTESFSKRKDRRKPRQRRSVHELRAAGPGGMFRDPGLQHLYEEGLLTELLGELKSGKEATVYLARGPRGLLAAKLYSDMAARSFKRDGIYRQGRYVGSARLEKAIAQRSRTGLDAQQALWILHEYAQLWQLQQAGVPAPRPLVGPGPEACSRAGRVVLMEFIGDEDGAAPRLADVRLGEEEAASAWRQSLDIMAKLLALGKIHGDYSTYNLLWWQGRVVVIDFPQMVGVAENPDARTLLEQDVTSLCKSFRPHGITADPRAVWTEVVGRGQGAQAGAPGTPIL
ncbi:MAG TPA: RIO1 family regulatory kinase/ATPase [Trueperaceae bacterium]